MKRSTFLTVLCILTFIGSGFGIVGGLISMGTSKVTTAMMDQSKTTLDSLTASMGEENKESQAALKLMNTFTKDFDAKKIRNNSIGQIFASIFCLLGALLMWKLKRNGFFLYLLGTIVGIAVPFLVFGTDSLMGILTSSWTAFIGIIFCILYYLNYKELS